MSVYFIHAEVIWTGDTVKKISCMASTSNAIEAFNSFMSCSEVNEFKSGGYDVVIDKLEKVE